jgi:hypothetical protein
MAIVEEGAMEKYFACVLCDFYTFTSVDLHLFQARLDIIYGKESLPLLLAKLINSKQITVNRDCRCLALVFWS